MTASRWKRIYSATAKSGGMLSKVDLPKLGRSFNIPVLRLQGQTTESNDDLGYWFFTGNGNG